MVEFERNVVEVLLVGHPWVGGAAEGDARLQDYR